MKQDKAKQKAVLASLVRQEAAQASRVELRLCRYNAAMEEIAQFDAQREREIEQNFQRVLAQVMSEVRQREWPQPCTVIVLAGPQGLLQIGPLPWEQHALA